MKKSHASLGDQLTAVFRWFIDWKVVCLVSMMFYTLIEMAFMFGEFTKVRQVISYLTRDCPSYIELVNSDLLSCNSESNDSNEWV